MITRVIRFFAASALALSLCLVVAEIGRRVLDGYRVWGLELTKDPGSVDLTWSDGGSTDALLRTIPIDIDTDVSWFYDRPAPLPGTAPEWAEKRRSAVGDAGANYIFNAATIKGTGLQAFLQKNGAQLGEIFIFRAPRGDTYPAYRFYPNIQSGFGFTNSFGFRSRQITKQKPDDVIRIAIFGDSTTNAYPDMVEHWLNRWANARSLGVRFEVVHAARPGTVALDAAAILEYELDGFEIDYAIIYGYGNAVGDADALVKLPDGVVRGQPASASAAPGFIDRLSQRVSAGLEPMSRHSAAAAFLRSRAMGQRGSALAAEPAKPAARVEFPSDIDERSPDVEALANRNGTGVMGLDAYLRGLNRLDATARERNIGVFVSSFRVLAFDGMLLGKGDSANGGLIYSAINERYWWPYRYSQIHRLMEFYNRAVRAWADAKGHGVIRINEQMPWRPELYGDGMHELPAGEALHAWIVLQEIMPRIRKDLASHTRSTRSADQAAQFDGYWTTERLSAADALNPVIAEALSKPPDDAEEVPAGLPLSRLALVYDKAKLTAGPVPVVTTSDEPTAYAAAVPLEAKGLSGRAWAAVRLKVTQGRVAVGLLDKSGSRFIVQRQAAPTPEPYEVYLAIDDLSQVGRLMILNDSDTGRSIVELHDIRLMRLKTTP